MSAPPRELYGRRVVKFAGDVTWPVVTPWPWSDPLFTPFEGSVVAVAIIGVEDPQAGGLVNWLYEDGTVDDSYALTLDDAIGMAEEEGDRLGWVELPVD